jgi:hypothetical protein
MLDFLLILLVPGGALGQRNYHSCEEGSQCRL